MVSKLVKSGAEGGNGAGRLGSAGSSSSAIVVVDVRCVARVMLLGRMLDGPRVIGIS